MGRFTWLVVFQRSSIKSTAEVAGKFRRRAFRFVPTETGIEDFEDDEVSDATDSGTVLTLEEHAAHLRAELLAVRLDKANALEAEAESLTVDAHTLRVRLQVVSS